MSGTEYQKLLDAVENYYGSGSDEWLEIARYGLSADNCTKILKQPLFQKMVLECFLTLLEIQHH